MAVLWRLVRASSGAASSAALRTVAAAHGPLEACARLLGNARARRRLSRPRLRGSRARMRISVSLDMLLRVFFAVYFPARFAVPFGVLVLMFFVV
jgi:hypothetical protein